MPSAGSCSHGGTVRYQDEMWKGSACEFCVCDSGRVTCQNGECAKVECAQVRSQAISTWIVTALSNGTGGRSLTCSLLFGSRGDHQVDHSHFKEPPSTQILWHKVNVTVQIGLEQSPGALSSQCICSDWTP